MHEIKADILLSAYAQGIFPMAENRNDPDFFWVEPEIRGILPIDNMHIPRRLKRTLKNCRYQVSADSDFNGVIKGCYERSKNRPKTWINNKIETLYKSLFELGYAHSVEVWFNSKLVGGLYGLAIGGAFFGESMFSRERDASKVALCHLVARLNKGNFKLLDTQFLTDHLVQFGCYEVTRDSYKSLLSKAISTKAIFHSNLVLEEFELFVQSTTQTS